MTPAVTPHMGVARTFQRGGHTESYRGYSPDCHLNIVGCLLTKTAYKGGITGTPGPPWLRPCHMGVARIFQRGGHTDSYSGYSSDCHLNIVGCLLTKRLTKGGSGAPQDPPGHALAPNDSI